MKELPAGLPPDRLAISSWCWAADYYAGRFSLLDMPARAALLGVSLLELNDFMLPPPRFSRVVRPLFRLLPYGNSELWRYRQLTLLRLRDELAAHGQQCLCWTLNTDFSLPPAGWPAQWLYWRWGVKAARTVGARLLRIILGGSDGALAGPVVGARLNRFLRYALDRFDGQIVLENHWGMSQDWAQHRAVFQTARAALPAADRPRFGLCLDPVNFPPADRPTAWAQLATDATHVHLKAPAPPDVYDLTAFLGHLDGAGYNGHFTLETMGLCR
ncbi:MAG: sugar phosphate isomerase/epimerase [Ardenticatenales bacterium]|nr:sugar phosphate isomerase/epimerase [Ardenticatenales bacterium]